MASYRDSLDISISIQEALREFNETHRHFHDAQLLEDDVIFGSESVVESIEFLSLIMSIESLLHDRGFDEIDLVEFFEKQSNVRTLRQLLFYLKEFFLREG